MGRGGCVEPREVDARHGGAVGEEPRAMRRAVERWGNARSTDGAGHWWNAGRREETEAGGTGERNPESAGLLGGGATQPGVGGWAGGCEPRLPLPSPPPPCGVGRRRRRRRRRGCPARAGLKRHVTGARGLSGGRPGRGRRRAAARPRWTARPVAAQVSAGPGTGGRAGGSGAHGAGAATHPRGRLCCERRRRRGTMGRAGTRHRSAAPGLRASVPGPRRSVLGYEARGTGQRAEGRAAGSGPAATCCRRSATGGLRGSARGAPRAPSSPLPAPPVPPGPAGSCRNFASYRRCAPRGPARGCHGVTEGAVAELLPRCRDGTADHGKATGPRVPDGEATSDAFGAGRVRGCCGRHPCGHWGSREGFREPAMAPAVLGINTFVFVSVGRRCVSPSSFSLSAGERLPVVPEA